MVSSVKPFRSTFAYAKGDESSGYKPVVVLDGIEYVQHIYYIKSMDAHKEAEEALQRASEAKLSALTECGFFLKPNNRKER